MKVTRARKIVYSNWDSEIFSIEMEPKDLLPESTWQALSADERLEIVKIMEARMTQVLYQRLQAAGLISEKGYLAVVEPIKPQLAAWDGLFGGTNGGNPEPEKAG